MLSVHVQRSLLFLHKVSRKLLRQGDLLLMRSHITQVRRVDSEDGPVQRLCPVECLSDSAAIEFSRAMVDTCVLVRSASRTSCSPDCVVSSRARAPKIWPITKSPSSDVDTELCCSGVAFFVSFSGAFTRKHMLPFTTAVKNCW